MLRPSLARRGAILPLVALALIAMFGMLALAIDLGLVALARTQCQNAADVAALAGVRQLNGDSGNNYAAADPAARGAATNNTVLGDAVDSTKVTVKVGYYAYNTSTQK